MKLGREDFVKVKGSPAYNYSNSGSITTTAKWLKSFVDNDVEAKYLPFNFTRIVNSSNVDIWFYKNQTEAHFIKALSSYTIKYEEIESFYVLTASGTATAGQIRVQLKRLPIDADEMVRQKTETIAKALNPFKIRGILQNFFQ